MSEEEYLNSLRYLASSKDIGPTVAGQIMILKKLDEMLAFLKQDNFDDAVELTKKQGVK